MFSYPRKELFSLKHLILSVTKFCFTHDMIRCVLFHLCQAWLNSSKTEIGRVTFHKMHNFQLLRS